MDERLTRPLAATLTAATLMGGITMPALADDTTTTTPGTGSGQETGTDTPATVPSRDDLKTVRIIAHTSDDGTDKGETARNTEGDDLNPGEDDEGTVPNGTKTLDVTGMPKGWEVQIPDEENGVYHVTFATGPDATVSLSYTITLTREKAAQSTLDAFDKAMTDTKDILDNGADAYAAEGITRLRGQYTKAQGLDPDTAVESDLADMTARLNRLIDRLVITNWTFQNKPFDDKGMWTGGTWNAGNGKPADKDLTVTGGMKGREKTLTLTAGTETAGMSRLGVTDHTLDYTTMTPDGITLTIHGAYATGDEITIPVKDSDPIRFTLDKGVFTATLPQSELARDNTIPDTLKTVTLSDGTRLRLEWSTPTVARNDKDARIWTATGTTAKDATVAGQPVMITMGASRSYDPSLTVTLERRDSKGNTSEIRFDRSVIADATRLDETTTITAATLPYDAIGDQYTVKTTTGGDVTALVKSGLGDNGARTWTITVTAVGEDGKTVTRLIHVTQPFDKATRKPENPNAALKGITVNGKTIQGWDPDILEYTIRAGEKDRVTVSPIAADGQTVKASDATQTAYTTVQHWIVTASDGTTRTYTVTLIRDHAKPTADEAFTPKDPVDRGGTVKAPAENTTMLKTVGYLLHGEYHAVDGSKTILIPEGGSFAYETYLGQTVRVQSGRSKGMTWRYDIGVLAPDGNTYASRSYTVTYVTAATSRAELTGITVDGSNVNGFKPSVTEYSVKVRNPEKYVTTAQWDKPTGMSVTKHVDGRVTTLTATSADGLHSRTYRVTGVKANTVELAADRLASTGSTARILAGVAVLLAIMGGALALVKMRATRRKPRHGAVPAAVTDDPNVGGESTAGTPAA